MNNYDPVFRIGDVSRMVGIAPETIRYYERKNVLRPSKNDGNGYRMYSMEDVCTLTKIRCFMKYGFSIEEAERLVHSVDAQSASYSMFRMEDMLQKKIDEQLKLYQSLQKRVYYLQSVMNQQGNYSVIDMPAFHVLHTYDQNGLDETKPIAYWYNHQEFVYPCTFFEPATFLTGSSGKIRMGMMVFDSDAEMNHFDMTGSVRYWSGACIYTSAVFTQNGIHADACRIIGKYLEQEQLLINGDILSRTVATGRNNDVDLFYVELYIPVKK